MQLISKYKKLISHRASTKYSFILLKFLLQRFIASITHWKVGEKTSDTFIFWDQPNIYMGNSTRVTVVTFDALLAIKNEPKLEMNFPEM